jgi:hypothetical protein
MNWSLILAPIIGVGCLFAGFYLLGLQDNYDYQQFPPEISNITITIIEKEHYYTGGLSSSPIYNIFDENGTKWNIRDNTLYEKLRLNHKYLVTTLKNNKSSMLHSPNYQSITNIVEEIK